jgi:hypothetical protein
MSPQTCHTHTSLSPLATLLPSASLLPRDRHSVPSILVKQAAAWLVEQSRRLVTCIPAVPGLQKSPWRNPFCPYPGHCLGSVPRNFLRPRASSCLGGWAGVIPWRQPPAGALGSTVLCTLAFNHKVVPAVCSIIEFFTAACRPGGQGVRQTSRGCKLPSFPSQPRAKHKQPRNSLPSLDLAYAESEGDPANPVPHVPGRPCPPKVPRPDSAWVSSGPPPHFNLDS